MFLPIKMTSSEWTKAKQEGPTWKNRGNLTWQLKSKCQLFNFKNRTKWCNKNGSSLLILLHHRHNSKKHIKGPVWGRCGAPRQQPSLEFKWSPPGRCPDLKGTELPPAHTYLHAQIGKESTHSLRTHKCDDSGNNAAVVPFCDPNGKQVH